MKSSSKLKINIKKNVNRSSISSKNKSFRKNNIYNKTVIIPTHLLPKEASKEFELKNNDISILSNANLNVIRILTTYANEDIINESSYLNFNNDNAKDRSSESKKYGSSLRGSPIFNNMKNNLRKKTNKSNHILNSNISNFSSDSIVTDRINNIKTSNSYKETNKSIFSPHIVKDKETISEDKNREKSHNVQKFSWRARNYNYRNSLNSKIRKKEKKMTIQEKSKPFANQNIQFKNRRNSCFVSNTAFNNHNLLLSPNHRMDMRNNYIGLLNELEIMKINEHIQNDINFIELKKKISKLKNMMLLKNNKSDSGKNTSNSFNNIHTIKESSEHSKDGISLNESKSYIENISISKKVTKERISISISRKYKDKDRTRALFKKDNIYDSFDDEEYKDEQIDYYIKPNSWYIKIFDSSLFFSSMIYLIYVPYLLSQNYFIIKEYKSFQILLLMIDIIYIIDVILNFFRAYINYEERLIRKTKKIVFHYLRTWFLLDLIQAIPLFSLLIYMERNNQNKFLRRIINENNFINPILYLLLLLKIIKVYKMFNSNTTIDYYSEILSKSETLDDNGSFIITIFLSFCFLNITSCIFIFLGRYSYPSWIIKLNIQDESYLNLYLTSTYFIIVTITTVGYGDITGDSIPEIIFQVLLLIVGTIAYSFIISYFSNYIIKINKKSMTFEKNLGILQEIKLNHPNMKNSIYNEVLRNLNNEQLYEKKDKHILFDCLPYSMKNKLIIEMQKPIINSFVFFKNIDNSDFIVKVVTSLKPLLSIKGDIVIEEGDFIKEIIFVKKGIINLNLSIDLKDPESSLKKYLGENDIGKYHISYDKSKIIHPKNKEKDNFGEEILNSSLGNGNNNNEDNKDNIEDIKIIQIRNNEHFGDALMFLNERCPLIAKVRTKTAELLILRKIEAIEIYSIYPNIWKRINKKSLFNMEQIYLKIKKMVIELFTRYNLKIESKSSVEIKNNTQKFNKFIQDKIENQNNTNVEKSNITYEDNTKSENLTKSEDITKSENDTDDQKNEIIKQKIKDLDEITIYSSLNQGMNMIKNMTFSKKTSEKESTSSPSKITLKNESPSKHLIDSNTCLIKTNDEFTKKNRLINKFKSSNENLTKLLKTHQSALSLFKLNNKAKEKCSSTETKRDNFLTNINSLFQNKDNLDDESLSDFNKRDKLRRSFTGKEELLYNVFDNLTMIKERNFQINSSYENINIISHYKYIKDNNLQSKTKKFIINESSNSTQIKGSPFLKLPGTTKELQLSNIKDASKSDFSSVLSEVFGFDNNNNKNSSFSLDRSNSEKNGIKKIRTKKQNSFGNTSDSNKSKKNIKKISTNKIIDIKRLKKFPSSQNIMNSLKFNSPFIEETKIKKKFIKKESTNLNKKLNIISNNIKNTSRIINNPEEFYMDFFNNILIKESSSKVYEKKKSITLATNSHSKKKEVNLSLKTNQIKRKNSYSGETSLKKDKDINPMKSMQTSLFNINE